MGCKLYKVKITLNNGYYYVKTMTENEVEEFKNDLYMSKLYNTFEYTEKCMNKTDAFMIDTLEKGIEFFKNQNK